MDGRSPKTFTVSGGEITLDSAVTGDVIVGLAYRGRWRSSKLAYGVADQSPMSRKKQIMDLAPLLYKTHSSGLKYGYSFDQMDYLPLTYKMEVQGANVVRDSYDQEAQALPGNWDTDSRLCLEGNAPLPCTVQALSMTVEGH